MNVITFFHFHVLGSTSFLASKRNSWDVGLDPCKWDIVYLIMVYRGGRRRGMLLIGENMNIGLIGYILVGGVLAS